MEPHAKEFTLSFSDIQGPAPLTKDQFSLTIQAPSHSSNLQLGSCTQLPQGEYKISLKLENQTIGETTADLESSMNTWLPMPPSYQLKLIGSHSLHRPLPIATGPPPPSKCSYIRKLEQIESSEKEIQSKMTESYFSLPQQYQDVFGKNVSISPGKGFFRKRTLDPSNLTAVNPDYVFSGHYEVTIANISASEEDILQNLAIALLTRKKELEYQLQEIELHQEVLTDFDFFIKSLGDSMTETKEQSETESAKMRENVESIKREVKEIERLNLKTDADIEKLKKEVVYLKGECEKIQSSNVQEKGHEKDLKGTVELRKALDKSQKDIEGLEKDYEKELTKFLNEYPEKEYASAVNQKILSLAELQRVTNLRDMELQENIRLQSEVFQLESQVEINNSLAEATKQSKDQEDLFKSCISKVSQEFREISAESEKNLEKTNKEIEEISDSLRPLQEKNEGLARKIEKNGEDLKTLKNQLEKIESLKKKTADKTPAKISREEFLNDFNQALQVDAKIRTDLSDELQYVSNLLLKSASASLHTQKVYRYVESHIENQSLQHSSITNMISSLKEKNPAYIPVKNDPTDAALAKYLNTHNNLEVKFSRLDKQVYTFGSIKVELSLEDGNVFVLVDGNRNKIEDFINLYTALEKGKIRRSPSKINESPGKRASKSGVSINK